MTQKYRQRGYMDSRDERPAHRPERKPEAFGPKTPRLPGTHQISRCANCGKILPAATDFNGRCPHCGFELHCCKQCTYFDTSARFECTQPITARIPRKDERNECGFYTPRVTLERQTSQESQQSPRTGDPRAAFEALFKK